VAVEGIADAVYKQDIFDAWKVDRQAFARIEPLPSFNVQFSIVYSHQTKQIV
jgi:hypothetical protein